MQTYGLAQTLNYCSPKLCQYQGGFDIACRNSGNFAPSCPADATVVNLNTSHINSILDIHNSYRNQIALGLVRNFSSAARMPTLKWNNELAYMAGLQTKTCSINHTPCQNTDSFVFVGQNIGIVSNNIRFKTPQAVINYITSAWFLEDNASNNYNLQNCCPNAGHFTQMICDRVTEIGCAMVQYTSQGWKNMIFTCDYSSANILGFLVYSFGKTGSKCATGMNPKYPGLCSVNEKVNPNILSTTTWSILVTY